MNNMINEH